MQCVCYSSAGFSSVRDFPRNFLRVFSAGNINVRYFYFITVRSVLHDARLRLKLSSKFTGI
jgi:hypothetical protein